MVWKLRDLIRARDAIEDGLGYDALERSKRMQIEAAKKLFTVDEYYRMAEVGILAPNDRVELIDGEIIEISQSAINISHA